MIDCRNIGLFNSVLGSGSESKLLKLRTAADTRPR
jgi:hypothetical protein